MALELDHLVVAATDLDSGQAWLAERLGATLAPGGQHTGVGTHNRLLQLGNRVYLELIASDPSQAEPARPRPFLLDDPGLKARLAIAPQLVHWVVRSNDLQADVAAATYQPGTIVNMTRGTLTWRLTVPRGGRPAGEGMLPSMIQWDLPDDQHPTARLPDVGVALAGLSIRAPQAVLTCLPKVSAPVTIDSVESATSTLVATFNCPRGRVSLGG
jgi:hypothetical protein